MLRREVGGGAIIQHVSTAYYKDKTCVRVCGGGGGEGGAPLFLHCVLQGQSQRKGGGGYVGLHCIFN